MRRIERLINLIAALLEARMPMTAEQIGERIAGYDPANHEAFRRTFERDKEALRAMGIPLEVVQTDPFGAEPEGYTIPKERYYLPELDLEPEELAALRIVAGAVVGPSERAEAGLMKLSLGSSEGPVGEHVVWGADLAAEQPRLGPVYSAVLEGKVLTFGYLAAGADKPRRRTVEPYALAHKRGNWYLLGRDVDRDDVRRFKVSRIQGALGTSGGNFTIPEGFDAAQHIAAEPWEIGPDESATAVVRFSQGLRWWAEQNLTGTATREGPDGALDVEMPATNYDALASLVIGFGDEVEILDPPAARAALIGHLVPFLESS
jgi:proteasome accessory factor B